MLAWIKHELKDGRTLISFGGLRVIGHLFTFVIPIVLAVRLSPQVFGIYSLGMMVIYFFNSTFILSSGTPFVIFGTEEIRQSHTIAQTITSRIILLAAFSVVFLLIMLIFKKQLIDFTGLTEIQFYFLVFVFTGKMLDSLFGAIFLALNKRILASVFQMLTAGLTVLYIIFLCLFLTVTLEKVFLMFLISPLISFSFCALKIEFKKIFPLSYDKESLKKMTDYTKWMILGGSAVYLLNWGDNLILRRFSTMAEIGVYNLGYQFFKGTVMMMAILKVYFLPFISQNIHNREKIANYLLVKRVKLLFLGIVCLGLLFLVMPHFLRMVYGSRYAEAALVFRILAIGALCAFYGMFYDPIFDSLKKYRLIQTVIAVCVGFNLLLDYILVARIGFMGAAVATAATYLLIAAIKEVCYRKYCRSKVT